MTEPPRRQPSRRGPRSLAATSAADAIANVIAHHDLSAGLRAERVVDEWAELVGERIAARTRPLGIVERALVIEVATSAWLHELSLLRVQLLTSLVARLGEPRLFDELKLKLAGRERPASKVRATGVARRGARTPTPRTPLPPPATGANRERIVREAEAVDDAELRALIARVRIAHDK